MRSEIFIHRLLQHNFSKHKKFASVTVLPSTHIFPQPTHYVTMSMRSWKHSASRTTTKLPWHDVTPPMNPHTPGRQAFVTTHTVSLKNPMQNGYILIYVPYVQRYRKKIPQIILHRDIQFEIMAIKCENQLVTSGYTSSKREFRQYTSIYRILKCKKKAICHRRVSTLCGYRSESCELLLPGQMGSYRFSATINHCEMNNNKMRAVQRHQGHQKVFSANELCVFDSFPYKIKDWKNQQTWRESIE